MGDTAIAGSTASTPAQAPASAPLPTAKQQPVAGPLSAPPVVDAPSVPKDGSRQAVGKPPGQLLPASALQSTSHKGLSDETKAALVKVQETERSWEEGLARTYKGDFSGRVQLDGQYWAFNDACKALVAAVEKEMSAQAGADPAKLQHARDELVARAEDVNAKVLVGEAAQQVIRSREPAPHPSDTKDPTAAATSKYPGLPFKKAEFKQASDQLDAVDACKDGRKVATDAVVQLQQAAAATRGAWFLACKDPSGDAGLMKACQLGWEHAHQEVQRVNGDLFVEQRENPAFNCGVAAYAEFEQVRQAGGDVAAAGERLLAAWTAAAKDAETRDYAYWYACETWSRKAEEAVKATKAP